MKKVGAVAGSIMGTRVVRKEDPRFMTSGGAYTSDLRGIEMLEGYVTS